MKGFSPLGAIHKLREYVINLNYLHWHNAYRIRPVRNSKIGIVLILHQMIANLLWMHQRIAYEKNIN
ncbi:MAG TPA: hypothetical protein DCS35_03735 [Vibrio sp.]|nr:hypothetical protein [Vibrio sp.]